MLQEGYPTPLLDEDVTGPGADGRGHLVTQQGGRDAVRVGDRVLWSWHPWPQHYLAAAGMSLFGQGAWQARLPFALVGLLCVPLVFLWRLRSGDGLLFAAVATAIFAGSPTFYLFARQARYYPLLFLGGLGAAWSYQHLRRRRVGATTWIALALSLTLTFYANPLTGVALAAGFGLHGAYRRSIARRRAISWAPLLRALVLFALLAAPWLAWIALSDVRSPTLGLGTRLLGFVSQLWRIQYVLLPAVFWPFLALWAIRRRRGSEAEDRHAGEVTLLAVLLAVSWLIVGLQAPLGTARYVLPLWPLAAVALAWVWSRLHRRSKALGGLFLALLLLTDLFPSLPAAPVAWARPGRTVYDREAGALDKLAHNGRIGLTLPRELASLENRSCGPAAAVVGVAGQLRRPPRGLVTDYGAESLYFHLGRPAVIPSHALAGRRRLGLAPPDAPPDSIDLVVPRRGWSAEAERFLSTGAFVPVRTGVPDHAYENLPDPTGHRYGPVTETPAWRPLPELIVWVRPELVPEGGFGPLYAPGCAPFPPPVVASPSPTNDPEPTP